MYHKISNKLMLLFNDHDNNVKNFVNVHNILFGLEIILVLTTGKINQPAQLVVRFLLVKI